MLHIHADKALFQSTPPRREVTHEFIYLRRTDVISIHTSPKGGDTRWRVTGATWTYFNPHLPEGR